MRFTIWRRKYSANACLILELDLCAADRKQRPWKHYTHKTDNIGAMTLSNLMRGYCRWNHERMSQQDTDFSFEIDVCKCYYRTISVYMYTANTI